MDDLFAEVLKTVVIEWSKNYYWFPTDLNSLIESL